MYPRRIWGLIIVSWGLLVFLVLGPAPAHWTPSWLAIFGWCEGLYGFGLPDFVMVESSHFTRFWFRCAGYLAFIVFLLCIWRHLREKIRHSLAWIALAIGGVTCALIGLGRWDYLLQVEGRYEAANLIEYCFGVPLRVYYMIGIAGTIGLLLSTTPMATVATLRCGALVTLVFSLLAIIAVIWIWGDITVAGMYSGKRTAAFVMWLTAVMGLSENRYGKGVAS